MNDRAAARPGGFDLSPPAPAQRARLEAALDPQAREVLLEHGTEAPFCGTLLADKGPGIYACRLCGLPLFSAGRKFDSRTGWPSFTQPFDERHLVQVEDRSYGMVRIEIRCARCQGHQGHVFDDGPPPAGLRFCINSVSLSFVPQGQPLPDPLGRGEAWAAQAAAGGGQQGGSGQPGGSEPPGGSPGKAPTARPDEPPAPAQTPVTAPVQPPAAPETAPTPLVGDA